MSELNDMNELKEKMEHASHGEHGHSRFNVYVGVTIAMLGVLLALCSALGGSERTDLIATMVLQSNTSTRHQALSTKYRILLAQLQQLHALSPDADKFKKWDDASHKLSGEISSPDVAKLAQIIRLENAKNLNAEIPTQADLKHFSSVIKSLDKENTASKEWTESYDSAVEAHAKAVENFERAQLAAEIGIVLASIALLFVNRLAWFSAIGLGITAVLITLATYLTTASQLTVAEAKIEDAHQHFESFNGDVAGKLADETLLKSVDEDQPPVVEP